MTAKDQPSYSVVIQVRSNVVIDEELLYQCNREGEAVGFKNLILMGRSYYSEMSRISDLLFPEGDEDSEWDVGLLDEIAEIVRECGIPPRYFKSRWTGGE